MIGARALLRGAAVSLWAAAACAGDPVQAGDGDDSGSRVDPLPPTAVVDELDPFDPARWQVMDHTLGRGRVAAPNVAPGDGRVELRLPAGTFDGAEFRSVQRRGPGVVEARLRAAAAPGSLTAFFLYEGRARRNDEVDVELLGGTRTALFTVWQEDVEVFHETVTLDFDPALGFHDYRITWSRDRVEWHVDGRRVMTATGLDLATDLFVYVNAWWPTWLQGGPPPSGAAASVDRVVT